MNRPILAVLLAATALSGPVAWAQPNLSHEGGKLGGGDPGHNNRPAPGQHQGQGQPQQQAQPQRQPQAQQPAQRNDQGQGRSQDRGGSQGQRQWQGGGGQRGGGGFSYGGRQHDQIQRGGFNYPSGYGYRRWGAGQILPFLFLTSPYIFDSYNDYGIGPPPRGYRWVRYGPDLLLVSRSSGRIRQVIYGVFY